MPPGDHAATERLADEARAAAREAGNAVLEAAAAAGAADAAHCRLRGEDPAALAAVDAKIADAARLAGALSDDQVAERLHMLLSLTLAHLCTGSPKPAQEAVQRGYAIARADGEGLLTAAFQCMRGFVAYELGSLDDAEADEEEAALISGNVPRRVLGVDPVELERARAAGRRARARPERVGPARRARRIAGRLQRGRRSARRRRSAGRARCA